MSQIPTALFWHNNLNGEKIGANDSKNEVQIHNFFLWQNISQLGANAHNQLQIRKDTCSLSQKTTFKISQLTDN